MKKWIVALAILGLSLHGFSQGVNFENINTWDDLRKKAQNAKKQIFIQIENNECAQCNDVATKGLMNTALTEKYNQHFICVRLKTDSDFGKYITERFALTSFPVSLYLDANGNFLQRFNGSTTFAMTYLENADKALEALHNTPFTDLENQFKKGDRSKDFLEKYLKARHQFGLDNNEVLDIYVGSLTVDSLKNWRIVNFLYELGPTLDSRAYKLLRATLNSKAIDSLYKSFGNVKAVNINRQIIQNTMKRAIKLKDESLARELSYFTYGTYTNDYRNAMFAQQSIVTNYFKAINDTLKFIQEAKNFCEYNLMNVTVDSLIKWDKNELTRMIKPQNNKNASSSIASINFAPPSQKYFSELNNNAWQFYLMTSDLENLAKALKWSKRSIELYTALKPEQAPNTSAALHDTYAHLLYKVGKREEAIEQQKQAVELQKAMGMNTNQMEIELEKMKSGKL